MNKLLVLFMILLLSACAHHTQDFLNSRMGKMNYEESLQRLGPPSQCAEAGATRTCIWIVGKDGMAIVPVGRMMVAAPMEGPSVRLTFIKDVLVSWQLSGRWE